MKDVFQGMNPKTRRTVTVLSIIALLILITGLISCFLYLSNVNAPPAQPSITVLTDRDGKDGKFLVLLDVESTDPDGDAVTYEYDGKAEDNYYPVGSHSVMVRAKDSRGGLSPWVQADFTLTNEAPARPVITRTPDNGIVEPGMPVTITADSDDPDGDELTYIWEGRPAETTAYALGKHTIRVKAVDSVGAESPWAAITFFVMDKSGSGGMTLTGPDSVIMEDGIEGATISGYTFDVPTVVKHKGQDYGRVRGYNLKTGEWEQLDYGETTNGISFEKSLSPGIYSRLEFYYFTNHDCMYDKSNITYTVDYFFE